MRKSRLVLAAGVLALTAVLSSRAAAQAHPRSPAAPFTGFARVNGLRMYYELHGSGGTPLVLIHGGGSTIGTNFGRVLPLLARSRRVIAVEVQAHGHTLDVDRPFTFEQDADDVAALLDRT